MKAMIERVIRFCLCLAALAAQGYAPFVYFQF
jgi:hypothetical protein